MEIIVTEQIIKSNDYVCEGCGFRSKNVNEVEICEKAHEIFACEHKNCSFMGRIGYKNSHIYKLCKDCGTEIQMVLKISEEKRMLKVLNKLEIYKGI